uniref:Coiled-coil domain-containing protein 12 n=1 Tax=Pinguiococcus pyrenoidosus TaxID=172671 RepID=A0A7R9UED8_9STRA
MQDAMDIEADASDLDAEFRPSFRRLEAGGTLRFRNYRPRDERLRAHFEKTQRAALYLQLEEEDEGSEQEDGKALSPFERALKEQTSKQDSSVVQIAPRKATWDLKRDIEKKLGDLERQTQRAIVEILRERVAKKDEADGSDEADDDLE